MSFRDILVHLDNTARSEARADFAVDLAERFKARLTALFAECDPYLANLASRLPEDMYLESAEGLHDRLTSRSRVANVDLAWSVALTRRDGALTRALIFAARHADLTVLGQYEPTGQVSGVPSDLVEQVALNTGGPVLVHPFAGTFPSPGRRVLIAWNGGREAARAVHDAMPFLEAADEVVLVAVNPYDPGSEHGQVPLADIARHLAVHGVETRRESLQVRDLGVMDLLLARVADQGSDLLVMGAHGHYGFPHLHRGGGTRHLLSQTTVPVLLSH